MKNEKALTLAQLDRVDGGTAAEYNEIIDTMISLDHTTTVSFAGILRGLRGGSLFLNAMAPVIALQLKRFYGIYSGTFVKTKIDEFPNVSGSRHCSIEQQCREVALCWRDVPDG